MVGNGLLSSLELLLVYEVVVLQRLHALVELKHQRARSRDVVLKDLSLRHAGQMFHHGPQTVAVCDYNHVFACLHLRSNRVDPVRHHALDGGLE